MSVLDRCTRRRVTLSAPGEFVTVDAWSLGDLAVHEGIGTSRGCYVITHMPTGLCVPFDFATAEAAGEAMAKIGTLRADWRDMTPGEIEILRLAVFPIAEQFGGKLFPFFEAGDHTARLNGYGEGAP